MHTMYSTAALAERWGCSAHDIRDLIKTSALPAFRDGSRFRIRSADVQSFEAHREGGQYWGYLSHLNELLENDRMIDDVITIGTMSSEELEALDKSNLLHESSRPIILDNIITYGVMSSDELYALDNDHYAPRKANAPSTVTELDARLW